jgi:hypothetical protein
MDVPLEIGSSDDRASSRNLWRRGSIGSEVSYQELDNAGDDLGVACRSSVRQTVDRHEVSPAAPRHHVS